MLRTTIALTLLLGSQAFSVGSKSFSRSVKTSMTAMQVVDMITQMDPTIASGIAASVLGGAGVAATAATKRKQSSGVASKAPTKVEKIDVSIPYNAAARLAYDEFRAGGKEADFETFKAKYEQMAVAQVTLKKLEREMAELN